MSADAQPNPKQRANEALPPKPPFPREKAAVGALCVVCGDRACSHLYYGVAACHGCKCFFWRTVKSGLSYVCRYDGQCSISTAGRNACRFCRFNRCLNSGMKLEAVRLDKKSEKMTKRKKVEVESDDYNENQENIESPLMKKMCMDNRLLTTSLLLIDKTATHSSRKQSFRTTTLTLAIAMEESDLLDGDRSEMSFRVSSRADSDGCVESERRLLIWAIDWTRQVADMEDAIRNTDKISLLRACWASLTLLELGAQSCNGAATVLPLPNNTFLHVDIPPPQNCFLNAKVLYSLLKWAHCDLKQLSLSTKELVLLKAIVVLNPDTQGLSPRAQSAVSALRDRVHSALYQHYVSILNSHKAAHRLAKVLLLIPQLTLMAVEVVEHLRLRHTFVAHPKLIDPLLFQLYGDIFEEGKAEEPYLVHSASCSPTMSSVDSS